MTAHIIACGDSAKHWNGEGFSIGVNDSWKWGHKTDWLVVVNHPSKFAKEPDRMAVIKASTPDKFISHTKAWMQDFPKMEAIHLTRFTGRLRNGQYYHSSTSPFVAISLAWNAGATEIVLWGVDFISHKIYHPGNKYQASEIAKYRKFIDAIEKHGTKTYLGAEGSALTLPIWKKKVSSLSPA